MLHVSLGGLREYTYIKHIVIVIQKMILGQADVVERFAFCKMNKDTRSGLIEIT